MLRGELTGLRARFPGDAEILHAELYEDVETRVRADSRPWVPIPAGPASPFWAAAGTSQDADVAVFSVVELATGGLAGDAVLWDIDPHNRSAHIGLSLRPACRGRGLGTDFPLLTPERWLRDFDTLDMKPDVRPKILKENAVRVLGLADRPAYP